jgi:predicted RNA binding protein YcfA (HicA-like mRNA interferase family)
VPKLPVVTARELVRALERDGWYVARTTGHVILNHPTKPGSVPVPNHPNVQVRPKTLRGILRSAGLSVDDLIALLK